MNTLPVIVPLHIPHMLFSKTNSINVPFHYKHERYDDTHQW